MAAVENTEARLQSYQMQSEIQQLLRTNYYNLSGFEVNSVVHLDFTAPSGCTIIPALLCMFVCVSFFFLLKEKNNAIVALKFKHFFWSPLLIKLPCWIH